MTKVKASKTAFKPIRKVNQKKQIFNTQVAKTKINHSKDRIPQRTRSNRRVLDDDLDPRALDTPLLVNNDVKDQPKRRGRARSEVTKTQVDIE